MKSLVVYSSLTGNTKMIAESIAAELGEDTAIKSVAENPSADGYDLVAVGYWVDKGAPDKKAAEFLRSLSNKKVFVFATLGAYPDSDHAKQSLEKGIALLGEGCEVIGTFICQGKVNPQLISEMAKMFPEGHPHAMNEARQKRLAEAAKHPNEADCAAAKSAVAKAVRELGSF
jgi:flavodoxin